MKLARKVSLAALGLGLAGLGLMYGCSSDENGDTGSQLATPPSRPSGPATTSTARKVFAVRKLLLGDTDRTGKPDARGWAKIGYDLDGVHTKKDGEGSCKAPGGGRDIIDGQNGIDNAFGSKILETLKLIPDLAEPSKSLSDQIEAGGFTILLDTTGLPDGANATATGLSAQLFAAGDFGGDDDNLKPSWGGSDDWPVFRELLGDGQTIASGSKVKFNDAYITDGRWVSGGRGEVRLSIAFDAVSLDLSIREAVITADYGNNKLSNGTIAGIVKVQELLDGISKVVGRFSTSACPGSNLFNTITTTIQAAADIRADGAKGGECDAISIGIGFEAEPAAVPTKVAPQGEASPDPCNEPPGGSDAGTDGGS
jgi:hypothetical protein